MVLPIVALSSSPGTRSSSRAGAPGAFPKPAQKADEIGCALG